MGFFLTQISIVSNIIPTARFAIIADRYVYLPSIGIFFLIAYLINQYLIINTQHYRKLILFFCPLYVIGLGGYATLRCKVWHNSDTLKKELIEAIHSRNDYEQWIKKNQVLF
jgi:hypothetical protein